MMVKLPPTSVKHVDTYMARLAGTLDTYTDVVTAITLKKEKNEGGVSYSEAHFAMVRRLTDEDKKIVSDLLKDFEKFIYHILPSRQFGKVILTTTYGIMDHEEAKRKHIGGKVLGYFY